MPVSLNGDNGRLAVNYSEIDMYSQQKIHITWNYHFYIMSAWNLHVWWNGIYSLIFLYCVETYWCKTLRIFLHTKKTTKSLGRISLQGLWSCFTLNDQTCINRYNWRHHIPSWNFWLCRCVTSPHTLCHVMAAPKSILKQKN